jgi:hypothetical protein
MRGHSVILIISNTDGSDDHHDQLITSRGKKISQEKRRERERKKKKGSFAHIHLDKRPRGHVLVCDATNRQTIEIDW